MVWYGPYRIEGSCGFLPDYKTTWFNKVELGCGNLDNINMGFLYSYSFSYENGVTKNFRRPGCVPKKTLSILQTLD